MIFDEQFINALSEAAERLKALAHPQRLQIVEVLAANEELDVSTLQQLLQIEQAIVSQHLATLKSKNLVEGSKRGKHCFYRLKDAKITQILHCIKSC